MEKKGTSWGWIVFWLVIFWPVGLFLAIKKLTIDKSALMSGKTRSFTIIGWIMIVFGGLLLIGSVEDDPEGFMILWALGLIIGGIVLLVKASKTKKIAVKYKQYIDIVVNQNVRSIDNIASTVGLSYNIVAKDLQNMIDIGYLRDAYIHHSNREIAFKQHESTVYAQATTVGQVAPQTIAVRCPGCGANNVVVVGKVSECEYCGNAINA